MSEETTSIPETTSMDTQAAVDSILIMPDSDEDKSKTDEVTAAEAATTTSAADSEVLGDSTEEAEVEEADEEEVEEDEEEDTEEEADEEDDAEDSEDTDEDDDDEEDEPVFTTADGDTVTLDEMKRGYLRQADYTKKTMEVAEARKALEAEQQVFAQNNQDVAKNLEMALNVIEPQLVEFAQTDWEALATSDPYEYAEKKALFEQAQSKYAQVQQAAQATVARGQAEAAEAKARYLNAEREKLQMALPDMADPKVGRKLAQSIKEYALTSGLTEQEASNITDHRMIVVLNKARQFDELRESGVSAAKKKLSKGPKKLVQAGKPKTRTQKSKAAKERLRANLKATGSEDDLAALMLGG